MAFQYCARTNIAIGIGWGQIITFAFKSKNRCLTEREPGQTYKEAR